MATRNDAFPDGSDHQSKPGWPLWRLDRRALLVRLAAIPAAGALSTLMAACGGDDDDDDDQPEGGQSSNPTATTSAATSAPPPTHTPQTSSQAQTAEVPATESEETAEPVEAAGTGIAIEATLVPLPSIDPAVGSDFAESRTLKQLYDTLYRHEENPPELVPWLAIGHEASDDAREWTFTLDERATFQDGSPVTADAVVSSLQRLQTINKGVSWMFSGIVSETGVEAIDPATVRFTLDQPFVPFLHIVTWLFVVNPAVVAEHEEGGDLAQGWLLDHSAGSGPFIIKRWEPDNLYEFEADPNWWHGWDGPHLDGYVHQVVRESSTKRVGLIEGDFHGAEWLSPEDLDILETSEGITVPTNDSMYVYNLHLNSSRGPTADVHVRRAFSYAFDYDAMIDVMKGRATRSPGPVPPTMWGHAPDLDYYVTDMERAKEELAQSAEWKDGFDIEYQYVSGIEEERQCGLIFLEQLAQLNINLTITPVQWATASASRANPETSPLIFPIYSGTSYPDPDNALWGAFHSSRFDLTFYKYQNPEVDALLEQGRGETDLDTRLEVYRNAQELLVADAAAVWIFAQSQGLVRRNELEGIVYCPVTGSWWPWYQMYLAQ